MYWYSALKQAQCIYYMYMYSSAAINTDMSECHDPIYMYIRPSLNYHVYWDFKASVLINRGILPIYGKVDHMTCSSYYYVDDYRGLLLSWLKHLA